MEDDYCLKREYPSKRTSGVRAQTDAYKCFSDLKSLFTTTQEGPGSQVATQGF